MTYEEAWNDLAGRLESADKSLKELYDAAYADGIKEDKYNIDGYVAECRRLMAKRNGVRLAIDYMRGYTPEGS